LAGRGALRLATVIGERFSGWKKPETSVAVEPLLGNGFSVLQISVVVVIVLSLEMSHAHVTHDGVVTGTFLFGERFRLTEYFCI
jgi:hypothetical protein